jgi:hypothetical protein
VLKFIPDRWDRTVAEAEVLEGKLSKGKDWSKEQNQTIRSSVENFFDNNWSPIVPAIKASNFYNKIKAVELDFPSLKELPNDFDSNDMSQIPTLVQAKIGLLKPIFKVY